MGLILVGSLPWASTQGSCSSSSSRIRMANGQADGFLALLEDDPLPHQIPENIPTVYTIPEDRAHVLRNQRLRNGYRLMGEYINSVLEHKRAQPKAKDARSHDQQIQGTVALLASMNAAAAKYLKKIHDAGDLPFVMPEAIRNRLQYILPVEDDNAEEDN